MNSTAESTPKGTAGAGARGVRGRSGRSRAATSGATTPPFLAVLALLATLLPAGLGAQDPDPPAPAAPDTIIEIAPLFVRVLAPALPAHQVPYAVSGADRRAALANAPGLALDAAVLGVPGIQVDDRQNLALGERVSIRGFGARSQFGVRGVAVVLDGVPLTLPDGQTTLGITDPAFLERVEVVRGPASALFGNAAGGALLLETLPPPARGWDNRLRVLAGAHGVRRLDTTNGLTAGDVGVRADVTALTQDGYRRNAAADLLRALVRAELPAAGGALELSGHALAYDAQNPGSLSDSLRSVDPRMSFATNVRMATGEVARQGQVAARWVRALGGAGSASPATGGRDAAATAAAAAVAPELELGAYLRARSISNPIPFTWIDLDRRVGGARALLRARPAGLPLTVGAEASVQADDRLNFANRDGVRGDLALSQEEEVRATSLFARAGTPANHRLGLLAGVRWDRYRFTADDRLVTATNPDDSGARTLGAWSPTAGVWARATDAVTLFANVATSFETPTTTELANRPDAAGGFNPALEPQRTVAVEAGARGLLGDVARWEVTGYRAAVSDALVPFEVASAPGRQFFRNAGSAVHRGVEASVALGRGAWSGSAAYTWTDARFDDYATEDARFDGNRIPGVAPHRVDATATWSRSGWTAAAETRWVAAIPVNDANTAESSSYLLTTLRLAAPGPRLGGWRAAPFASLENALDEDYNGSVTVNAFGGRYYEPGPGRALFIGVRVEGGGGSTPGG